MNKMNTIKLEDVSTLPPDDWTKDKCTERLIVLRENLDELQNVFYADSGYSLLILFQGMDTSGKDGVIRHVMTAMNPMGLHVKSFKVPTEEEDKHDILWRIYPNFPELGMVQVFNRSYYEDIVVPFVENKINSSELEDRCKLMNELEEHLRKSRTHILKFFLHISKEEQLKRINERLTIPRKKWKYKQSDLTSSKHWDEYMKAYNHVINHCNTSPWFIVPSDKRWYRNMKVAEVIQAKMESLKQEYPENAVELTKAEQR